jgi:hypothetical protein
MESKMQSHDYKGYRLRVVPTGINRLTSTVTVYWPGCFLNPLFRTTSLDKAMRWVDAYIKGEQWAQDVKLPATVG